MKLHRTDTQAVSPILALTVLLLTFITMGCATTSRQGAFAGAVSALEQRTGGSIGVYALDTGTGQVLAYRGRERFAMASTFKPLLVAAVLAEVDAGRLRLDDAFAISEHELVSWSPVTGELEEGETISLAGLCDAVITISDNTAANMLLDLVGGPEGLTQFLRSHGDDVTRLDRYEVELNSNFRGDERDTTTSEAMVSSLARFLFSDILSSESRLHLQDWLVASRTGAKRLRAGLPAHWRVGDKTGSGKNGAANDVAVVWPPGREPIVIAVYLSWSGKDIASLNLVHVEVARLVVEYF